ncbi:hypothetical protein V1512DRAFT_261288 [Lipomyces arxii]|uniref:uncharacterized protein n=1 Tax=Lipomyces arxii TaxID=56418 RepID=UPI0034CEC2D1
MTSSHITVKNEQSKKCIASSSQSEISHIFRCPDDIFYIIFLNLSISDLTNLRLVSSEFDDRCTLNMHWKAHVLKLWKSKDSMAFLWDDNLIGDLAFDLTPRGWFHAHIAILKTVKSPWMLSANDLYLKWRVYMKRVGADESRPSASGSGDAYNEPATGVVTFREDGAVISFGGLWLFLFKWAFDKDMKSVQISAYPALVPSRVSRTWRRLLFHRSAYLLAPEPQFETTIYEMHKAIMNEFTPEDGIDMKRYDRVSKHIWSRQSAAKDDFDAEVKDVLIRYPLFDRQNKSDPKVSPTDDSPDGLTSFSA